MTLLRIAVLGLAAGTLSGCTYTVEVRNATPDPITVRLLQIDPVQPDWVLASARIEGGGRAHLKESRVAFEKVMLEANVDGADDDPVRTRVRSGARVFRIDPGPTAAQPIIFVEDPTPWTADRVQVVDSEGTPAGGAEKPR